LKFETAEKMVERGNVFAPSLTFAPSRELAD
jgi:hypothetical protein